MDNINNVFREYLQKRGNNTNEGKSKYSVKSIEDFYINPLYFKKETGIYKLLNSYDILYSLYDKFVGNKCYHDIQQTDINYDDTLSKYHDIFNIFMNHLSNTNTIIKLYYLGRYLNIDVDINVLQRLYYILCNDTTTTTHFNIIYDSDCIKELEIVSDYVEKIKNNDEYKNSLDFK